MHINLKDAVDAIHSAGFRFEIEMLTTGAISMEVINPTTEECIASELSRNGPEVSIAVESLIKEAKSKL